MPFSNNVIGSHIKGREWLVLGEVCLAAVSNTPVPTDHATCSMSEKALHNLLTP